MENVNKTQLGDRIRELRTAAGHTQDDLAALLDKHRQVVSYYENGTRTPNLNELITIAKEYNTTTDYLLGLSNVATTDTDIKDVCDYTGLNETSVKAFNDMNLLFLSNKGLTDFLNSYIEFLFVNRFLLFSYFNELKEYKKIFSSYDKKLPDEELDKIADAIHTKLEKVLLLQYRITKAFNRLFDDKDLDLIFNADAILSSEYFNQFKNKTSVNNNEQ